MIDAARLLAGLPLGLRGELLEAYGEIVSNYLERRWGAAELNGGKLCEVVYSILNGVVKGPMPQRATKPTNMLLACQALEKQSADANRVGDRSMRIMLPRLLPVLYEVRNNRGVGHVGGDVSANQMDAEAVQAMASWVMAELVRIFHDVDVKTAQEAVDALVERKTPLIWELESGMRRVLDASMGAKDQTLLLLHHSPGWVASTDLFDWIEYSTPSNYRKNVLVPLHDDRRIEHDSDRGRVRISPKGAKDVEDRLLKST